MAANKKISSEAIASRRLAQVPKAPPRKTAKISSTSIEKPDFPFEVYTWQLKNGQFVIMGKHYDYSFRLMEASIFMAAAEAYTQFTIFDSSALKKQPLIFLDKGLLFVTN